MDEKNKKPGMFHNPDGTMSNTKVMTGVGTAVGVVSFIGGAVALLLGNPAGAALMTNGIYLFVGGVVGRQVKHVYDYKAYPRRWSNDEEPTP